MNSQFFSAPLVFDGENEFENAVLEVSGGHVAGIHFEADLPSGIPVTRLAQGMIVPGFVDLQVNGGGGVLLNNSPTEAAIRHICAAHRRFGTTSLLATLITDRPEIVREAIAAGVAAAKTGTPGFRGLHIEGPHLAKARKGTHNSDLIRPMDSKDLASLLAAASGLETLMVTIAPESVSLEQVKSMSSVGIIVSLGHSDTDYETAMAYFEAGAQCVTHLFNAMSQIGSREPGLVGAALAFGNAHAGLIADGFHVHPANMIAALRAKNGPGRIHLVTDAMSTVGSDIQTFMLNGREISRAGGRLTLADGTLAGADVDMISCVRHVCDRLGVSKTEALRMAGLYPAQCIKRASEIGTLRSGARADFLHLSENLDVLATFIDGEA